MQHKYVKNVIQGKYIFHYSSRFSENRTFERAAPKYSIFYQEVTQVPMAGHWHVSINKHRAWQESVTGWANQLFMRSLIQYGHMAMLGQYYCYGHVDI